MAVALWLSILWPLLAWTTGPLAGRSASGTGQGPRITQRQYSTAGRLTRVTLPDGANLDLAYSPDGLLTNRSGGRQPTVGYAYDPAGRLTTLKTWKNATTQTGAKTTRWTYQAGSGFMVYKEIGGETPIEYTFTAAGRPRSEMVMDGAYPATEWKYGFDATPVVRRTADVTEALYSGATDLDGNPATPDLRFTYDRTGRRVGAAQVTSGTTNTAVTWSRNSYGLITAESWSDGPLAGHILGHTYDDRLRRTNLTFRVGTTTNGMVGYGFDTSGRISWIGDGASSATYTYAANSPLIQQVQLRNGSTVTLAVTRQYDRWNRLQTMTAAGTSSGVVGQEYTYNEAGQRIRAQLLDGSYWIYEYDPLGQVKSARRYQADGQVVAGQQFEYSYDDIGNRTSGKAGGDTAGSNLRTTTETTDAEGRLVQRANPRQYEVQGAAQAGTDVRVNGVVSTRQGEYFRYEGTASGTTAKWLDPTVTLNGATLITGRKKYVPPQTETLVHDVSGNRIQDGRWEMAWDNENRLIDVRTRSSAVAEGVPNQRLRYAYDADGRLIERKRFDWVSGAWSLAETTRYLNDGLQCVAEFNASNALQRRQVWGLDLDGSRGGLGGIGGLLWIVSQANGTHYAAPDGSGNVVALFGTGGTETARYEYGPFGELLRMSGGAIAAENPWRFSSKRQDPTTEWVHYEYRVYDPASGRWLSRDPIGEAGGENLYGFVGNDPVNRVDLFGFRTPRTWSEYQEKLLTLLNLLQLKQQRQPSVNCAPAVCGAEQARVATHGDDLDRQIEILNRELGLARTMLSNWSQTGPAKLIAFAGAPLPGEGDLPADLGSLDGPPATSSEAEALNSGYWQNGCYTGCFDQGIREAPEMIPGATAFGVARGGLGIVRCVRNLKASAQATKSLAQHSQTAGAAAGLETRGLRPLPGTRQIPEGIPDRWRIRGSQKDGGIWCYDPAIKKKGNAVRVMPGDPKSLFPNTRSPYVRWQRHGQALDRNGNVIPKDTPDAHIPLQDFKFNPDLFK